jgi:Uma2 family endonuclease
MASAPTRLDPSAPVTVADLLKRLGDVPARRVRLVPTPGTATMRDLLRNNESPLRTALCELVERTLVEKAMGAHESFLAMLIGTYLNNFVLPRNLGIVLAPDGMLRLNPGLLRAPDVSFIAWKSLPGRRMPDEPILDLAPDLAVEVLSKGNTRAEMARKVREYFDAGTRLVWIVDHRKRVVRVYTSPRDAETLTDADTLDGAPVLPGFGLPVRELFDRE